MKTSRLRRSGLAAAIAGLIALGAFSLGAQTTLTPEQMRIAATQSLKAGQPAQAAGLADALLARDAQDLNALLIRARALRDLGQMDAARQAARRAWSLAENDADRFAAALITAQVLSSDGKRTRAQLWLRRAGQHAPNDALRALAKRDFNYVRTRNPWQTHLSFTLAPSSNINNGSARDRSLLNYRLSEVILGESVEFDLTGSARELSGLEYGAALSTRYRFSQTATTAHDARFNISYRSFILSDSAKTTAPDASGSDFSFGVASLGYGYRRINMDQRGEFSFDASLGQTWYGGARYARFARTTLAQTWRRNRHQQFRFAFFAEQQDGQRTADITTLAFSASLNHRLENGSLAFFKVGAEQTHSDTADSEYREIELRSGYVLGRPVMGAALQFGLGAAFRDYDVSRHSREGRQDRKIFADVTATFTEIDYYGFNPSVTLSAASTDSNIGLFDVNRLGISVGIKSSF